MYIVVHLLQQKSQQTWAHYSPVLTHSQECPLFPTSKSKQNKRIKGERKAGREDMTYPSWCGGSLAFTSALVFPWLFRQTLPSQIHNRFTCSFHCSLHSWGSKRLMCHDFCVIRIHHPNLLRERCCRRHLVNFLLMLKCRSQVEMFREWYYVLLFSSQLSLKARTLGCCWDKKVLVHMVSENYIVALHIPCSVW